MTSGRAYRIAYSVSGRTSGTVRAVLTDSSGGNGVLGTLVNADGNVSDKIVAGATSAQLRFSASSDFDGSIDDVAIFAETTTCCLPERLTTGFHPQLSWRSGTAAGPFAVTIK